MKKIVFGIIGEDDSQKRAIKELFKKNGFKIVKISDKVKEVASYLNGENDTDVDDNTILEIRNRGYIVSKLYWINLILPSLSSDCNSVLIEDMEEEDMVPGVIRTYSINKNINNCNAKFVDMSDESSLISIEREIKKALLDK